MPALALPPFKVQVLRLRGELSLEDMAKIRALVSDYLQAGLVNVVLNLEQVTHVHLSGLPVLGERQQRLRQYGGDLKLAAASPYVRHIFDLAGVGTAFDWCGTEDEAAERFSLASS